MISGTYVLTISGVDVVLHVSTVSATIAQMAIGAQLWGRLLAGVSTTPQSSPERGGDKALGRRISGDDDDLVGRSP